MDAVQKKRLHWLMYGLFYPAVLGTGVVVALQHAAAHSMQGPALPVAVTAGAFFSLSFASAMGFEAEYGAVPFMLDVAEVLGMFACLVFLSLIEPAPPGVVPSVTHAYEALIAVVISQVAWRKAMGLEGTAFLDLKLILLLLLVVGAVLGDQHAGLHWTIACIFSVIAWLYVHNNPYQPGVRRWYFVPK